MKKPKLGIYLLLLFFLYAAWFFFFTLIANMCVEYAAIGATFIMMMYLTIYSLIGLSK